MKLFYRAKRLKHEKQNNILPLYTALLSMVLCMVCLGGTTWAWFTANQVMEVEPITAAEWAIESIEVYQIASGENTEYIRIPVNETEDGMKFDVEADTNYAVSVSIRGNSSTGYLHVETCDGNYYTTKSDIDFDLLLSEGGTVKVIASWGVYAGSADELSQDDCIGNGAIPVCECSTLCTDEAFNGECKVCSKERSLCIGEETTTEETTADEIESADETSFSDETTCNDETESVTEPDNTEETIEVAS